MTAVVGVHAVGESGRSFGVLRPWLEVVAPDLRGHGDAPKPADGYSVGDYAADVVGCLAAPSVLVGASSGGLVAQRVAADHPDLVLGLVLVGSPHTLQGRTIDVGDLSDPAVVRAFSAGLSHRPLDAALLDQLVEDGLRAPPHVWEQTIAGLVAEPPVTGIAVPTIVLWGAEDRLLPRAGQEAMVAGIPDAELRVLPGIGHLPLFEAPEAVADAVKTLLKGRL